MHALMRPVALFLALVLLASPASADCGKDKDKKHDPAVASSSDSASSDNSTTESAPSQEAPQKEAKCEPVGVQLTPPPPKAGVDPECVHLPGTIFLGH